MYSINFSNKAVEDLSDNWNYSAKRCSVRQANYYYNFITLYCKSIGNNPVLLGTKYDKITEGLLGCKIKEHIVFYQIKDDYVFIIRILHKRMDIKKAVLF